MPKKFDADISPEQAAAGLKHGWRSGLEEKNGYHLEEHDIPFGFEILTVQYKVEETKKYTPDFVLPNCIIIETKGRFTTADRKKMLLVKAQHPDLDIRLVFQNPKAKINKGSKTTYAQWADSKGFLHAPKFIPMEWCQEPTRFKAHKALVDVMGELPDFCFTPF